MKRVLIVTGQSGSGKSSALAVLEDLGYYCIDNLPLSLLPDLVGKIQQQNQVELLALGVDIRSGDFANFPDVLQQLKHTFDVEILYFLTQTQELITRFNLSRRPHPLAHRYANLAECIEQEHQILADIREQASIVIDSTAKSIHDLKQLLLQKIRHTQTMSVIIQSFGFKYGVPLDSDYVFDVRHLPNPHWHVELREQTGLDTAVRHFLQAQPAVTEMLQDLHTFLTRCLPQLTHNHRHYVTISIGCTGGQHRSVYIAEQLKQQLIQNWSVHTVHREQNRW